jgi:hypothetical protein
LVSGLLGGAVCVAGGLVVTSLGVVDFFVREPVRCADVLSRKA